MSDLSDQSAARIEQIADVAISAVVGTHITRIACASKSELVAGLRRAADRLSTALALERR